VLSHSVVRLSTYHSRQQRIIQLFRGKYRNQIQPGPGGPQQPPNPPGSSSTPLMAPANVRNNQVAQQRAKRNSTSPGEEEGSSPKRPRPSPSGGDHPNPPGPPQNQPPMASMAPFNPQQGGGPPGPQNMQNGMIRQPMNMAYQSMVGGFGPPMSPGMVSIQTPGMMNTPMHMTPEVGPVGLSSSWTGWYSLPLLDAKLQAVDAKTSPQRNGATSDRQ